MARLDGIANPLWYPAETVTEWCEQCVHPIDGTVNTLHQEALTAVNIQAMDLFDMMALLFATIVVAFAVVSELKE